MSKWRMITTLTVCLLGSPMLWAKSSLYSNATVLDVDTGQQHGKQYILVEDQHIVYIGSGKPEQNQDTQVIDLEHRFVMPGLIDSHAHMSLGAVSATVRDKQVHLSAYNGADIAAVNANSMLRWGITTIRNPGGDSQANVNYKQSQVQGQVKGPKAFVAGHLLNDLAFAGLVTVVDDELSIANSIEQQSKLGVDYVKLYTGLTEQQLKSAVRHADSYDLQVIAHLEKVNWQTGAQLGIDHIVHAMPLSAELLPEPHKQSFDKSARPGSFRFFEWYELVDLKSAEVAQMINSLREHNVSVDPTLIVFYNAFFGDQDAVTKHPALSEVHPSLLTNWQTFFTFNLGWTDADFKRAQAVWPKVLEFVKMLDQAGVTLTIGTDVGNPWTIPGISLHQEMALMVEAGISEQKVLQMATRNGAYVIDKDAKFGLLKTGYIADFIVLDKNPLLDIKHTQSIHRVVQNGTTVHLQQ
ncbi:hypothetical protein E2K93_11775 [Thalassotalea sp. HSM 43]|uniref:amidohydrolase family protein n=1 Tax=Thalassotalea sp. HSM 43 TaxID=2552945 RepID=UPI001080F730|nr:amidohydrolase family protein [Thalassotalea sp. HSM 43]QBY05021.1 hypothetical protein E2K93_11775 [Thalassotalea sp. HSM 43]